ncbi:dehydration-responsive element-binding protein 1E-like [Cicer arietinum]|uniref:Dehydration-responsive element-binding protein 1E-like n=1 Tax=Cicer arietinum TaxID=3827 RepID=A0A1S2Z688_CICAR|nr:dehydration-responsive element-binding protein 1E-like [Cicer arietinum]
MKSIDESSYQSISSETMYEEIMLASEQPKKRAGRRIFKETRHPVYRGVRKRNNNKWVCEVRVPKNKSSRIWLGTYPTAEMAARAHDVAALALRGKSACLNFADSAWRLTLPASTNAKEIKKMAEEAALAFASNNNSVGVMEDEEDNKGLVGLGLCVEVPGEEHDWFRIMADEPLRSPITPFIRYGNREWSNMDVDVDVEVSLWSFTI